MRKTFVMALAISVFMALGAGAAFATGSGGGGGGDGKPCNPNSPANGGPHNPGCNGGNNGCKDKNKKDKTKCPPPNNCKSKKNCPPPNNCKSKKNCPPDEDCKDPKDPKCPPAGNCTQADLVLFDPAKIVCLYAGEKAPLASKDADCPDALLAVPINPVLGVCVFLPPETGDGGDSGGGGLPGLPPIPGLPTS